MQARSGLQSSDVPCTNLSSPSPSEDLDAQPTSSVVNLSSSSLADLEAESSSSVVDQDNVIPNNVGAAPMLGQNQAGQVRTHFNLSVYALMGQLCSAW